MAQAVYQAHEPTKGSTPRLFAVPWPPWLVALGEPSGDPERFLRSGAGKHWRGNYLYSNPAGVRVRRVSTADDHEAREAVLRRHSLRELEAPLARAYMGRR